MFSFLSKVLNNYKFILPILIISSLSNSSLAQNKYKKNFYGGLFYLSEYIASNEFVELKNNNNYLVQIDSLYKKALLFFNYDISESLLCLTFTCLPYNNIKIRMPFNSQIIIPLPSPPQNIFNKRLSNLPSNIFFDSPQNDFGDKDKLSHFFGNAFLRYNFGFFNLSKFMGIFVENVEEAIFIEGGFDKRDIIANNLGELFGNSLRINNDTLPSEVLILYQLLFFRYYQ